MKKRLFFTVSFIIGLLLLVSQSGTAQSYTISPNGYICSQTTTVTLSGSQTSKYYQVATENTTNNGTYYSSWMSGTGSAISWSNVPADGTCVVYISPGSAMPTSNASGSVVASGAIFYQSPPHVSMTATGNTALTPGNSITFNANITPTSTVTGPWTYLWFLNGQPVQNSPNTQTYTASAAGSYSVDIVGNCSGQMTNAIVVTQAIAPGTISPAEETANANVAGGQLTGTLPAIWSGTIAYQWLSSADGTNWNPITVNGTGQNYTPTPQTSTLLYKREVINGSNTAYSNTSAVIVSYSEPLLTSFGHSMNYILTSIPKVAGITTNAGLLNQTTGMLQQSIQYFDGLGRIIQSIQIKDSPHFNDVVKPVAYDALGRIAQDYLAYTSTVNDGSYKPNALTTDQAGFYTSPPSGSGVSSDASPYATIGFEPSPINRIIEQGAPGTAWQLAGTANSSSTNHTKRTSYTTNDQTSTFSSIYTSGTANPGSKIVALYTVLNNVLTRTNNSATYAPGQLNVTISRDENWQPTDGCIGTTEEYKDLEGHVVLTRHYNLKVSGSISTVEMLSTYYVYDIYGNLCFVLPPGASPDANIVVQQTTLNSLCYQYQYDLRNRMIAKALPGHGWEYTVYNTIDQVVATQDANQAAQNEWVITKYDAQGRVVMTALWNNGNAAILQTALQTQVNNGTILWESASATGNGYTNQAWPTTSIIQILTLNYYDNYINIPSLPGNFIAPAGATSNATGLLTVSQANVLGTANMLWSAQYYDKLGRVITSYKQHYFGGTVSTNNYDQLNTTYNFNDQVTTLQRMHYNTSNPGNLILTVFNKYIYDQAGRKINSWQKIQNGTGTADLWTLVAQNVYNEVGQLLSKNLHNNTDSTVFYQSINYAYNERGWLFSSSAPLFNEQLEYNTNPLGVSSFSAQYNGNITGQTRVTNGALAPAPVSVSYSFSYDRLNRLTAGISTDGNSEQGINYDQMGNITALQRTGIENDNLTYSYVNAGLSNQLLTIQNVAGTNSGFVNGTTTYNNYDPNGNTAYDGRNATGVTYNLLNLPQSITAKNITYTYDAVGNKLRKVNGTNSTEYLNGIEYDNGSLSFVTTEEGQAIPNGTVAYNYNYDLTDHLNNVRVTFDTGTGVVSQQQQNDYYPFGLNIARNTPYPPERYLYNKKELQDGMNQYDYGARFYDPVIARWTTVDPLAEESRRLSPYNYGENNPIGIIDPDGMSTTSWMQANGITANDLTNIYTALPESDNQFNKEPDENGGMDGQPDGQPKEVKLNDPKMQKAVRAKGWGETYKLLDNAVSTGDYITAGTLLKLIGFTREEIAEDKSVINKIDKIVKTGDGVFTIVLKTNQQIKNEDFTKGTTISLTVQNHAQVRIKSNNDGSVTLSLSGVTGKKYFIPLPLSSKTYKKGD
ncbi:DUF6443 domain-containing protein [Mucilaginibacter sp. E4BP6]|uniref:DUF6443 domain-containing protein n=1 Tax=Mucilaginibacter sp. E4BP6 TaxID=2723089 RepID=UPI0015CADEFB|nr:DUF6443 domain-containing protein [Mucilaginibacter sp. E4BP6]NYE68653.1 RHS repeat-associated protein [Mucilaginibacter sp. E4BP6]